MINNYIGNGLVFPIQIDSSGAPVTATGFTLLNSSIKLILGWTLRTRIFMSGFGSILELLLEEPNDDLLKGLVQYYIFDSLTKWEKRIELLEIEVVRTQPEQLQVSIRYKIKATGLEEVLVYPYYNKITQ